MSFCFVLFIGLSFELLSAVRVGRWGHEICSWQSAQETSSVGDQTWGSAYKAYTLTFKVAPSNLVFSLRVFVFLGGMFLPYGAMEPRVTLPVVLVSQAGSVLDLRM